jgi:methanogenic corrinoid protein MtbC1
LLALDRVEVKRLLMEAAPTSSPMERIESLIVPVLERIGLGWDEGRVALSQVYMSGRLCEELVDLLLPPLDPARRDVPPMAIAVLEDYHLLGLRIVYSALRASGFALRNYGRCDLDTLAVRVKADGIRILLLSVLMLPSALRVKDLRSRLERDGCKTRIVVGGAPFRFDDRLWKEVGADAMGHTAADAVAAVNRLAEDLP